MAKPAYSRIPLGLIAFALFPATHACTAFDDAVLPDPGAAPSTSGQGGSSNTGGAGGGSSTAGTGGTGGLLTPLSYLGDADAARVCSTAVICPGAIPALALSIGVPVDATNYSQCMTWLAGPISPNRIGFDEQKAVLQCLAAASTCNEAGSCLPFIPIIPNAPVCSDGQSKCIDAQSAANCTGMFRSNCGAAGFASGSTCNAAGGTADCVSASCNSPGTASCSGNIRKECNAAGQTELSCSLSGLKCNDVGQNSALCEGGGTCSKPGITQCSGNIAQICAKDAQSEFNCADIGAHCIVGDNGEARCEMPGAACTPFDADMNVCSNGKKKITVCIGGTARTINCPIGNCQNGSGGQSAYCG